MQSSRLIQRLPISQGAYYLITGLWSMVSMRSFQWVTGRKTDIWLVRSVALLLMVIGMVLAMAGFRQRTVPEVPLLGAGSAAVLAGIDIVYAVRGRISRIYLLDALVELVFLAVWARACLFRSAEGEQDR